MTKGEFPLEVLDVKSPCTVPWESMPGDDRSRFCSLCRQTVYNVAAMPLTEIADLVRQSEGQLCVRLSRRADGTLITRDCRPRSSNFRRAIVTAVSTAASLLFVLLGGVYILGRAMDSTGEKHGEKRTFDPLGIVPKQKDDSCGHSLGSISPRDQRVPRDDGVPAKQEQER